MWQVVAFVRKLPLRQDASALLGGRVVGAMRMPLATRVTAVMALLGAALGACSGTNDRGIEVRVELVATPVAPGVSPRLTRALLNSSAIELVSCGPSAAASRRWRDLFERRAEAHVRSSPTRLGAPLVMDLTTGELRAQGTLGPPPGRYCAIKWEVGPADNDAPGVEAGADIVGWSVVASVLASGSTITARTAAHTGGSITIAPWTLDGTRPTPFVVRLAYDVGALLAGVTPGMDEDAAGRQLLANLSAAISVSLP
jgi:hypothetical protein